MRAMLPVLFIALVTTLAATAAASDNYPAIIDDRLEVECPNPLTRCLVCHNTAAGGEDTASQPFAVLLQEQYGLEGKSGRSLARALEMLPEAVDTDADGTPDLEELESCRNPSGEELSEGPGYGCNARLSSEAPRAVRACWVPLLAFMIISLRRRRALR